MSFAEIEAELPKLTAEELRRLAVKSWHTFMEKQSGSDTGECIETDPQLLAALQEAIQEADAAPSEGLSASEVRARMREWISR